MRLAVLVVLLILAAPVSALFGLGRKKKAKEEEKAAQVDPADAINVGMENLMKTMADPDALKQTMEMMQDPETMAEVEKLMSSPEFKAEMEALMDKPEMKAAMEAANELMQDPEKLKDLYSGLAEGMQQLAGDAGATPGGKASAGMGLDGLAAATQNPNILGDTLKMLDDPEIQQEVKKLMNDPSFKNEMEQMMSSPEYADAMQKAQEELAELSKDPAKLAEMQEQARAMLNA